MKRQPRVVILVPRRNDGGHRDTVWAYCRARWEQEFPDWPIFEGHHDDGLFNRSAACNRAAALAGAWDMAVLIDSDVLVDAAQVREAVAIAKETGDHLVLPFSQRHNLTRQGSQRVMAGEQGSWRSFIGITYTQQCSAVVVIPRGLWDQVGGFDEQFVGWGFEDNAFAIACETYGGRSLEMLGGELWHLWHPTAKEGRQTSPTYRANRARHELYRAALGNEEKVAALMAGGSDPIVEVRARENIPRILHRVVPEKTTTEVEAFWTRFQALHPGWEFMTHRDPLDPAAWPLTARGWGSCSNGAQLAGLIRLEALYRWGGIYVDSDCEPFRSLEPLLPLRAFAAWEDAKVVPDAVLGAEPEHPAIRACIDLALRKLKAGAWASGPGVTTAILPRRADVTVLPPGVFYPYHYTEKNRRGEDFATAQPWAFLAHHWAGSWLEGTQAAPAPSLSPKVSFLIPFRDADGTRTPGHEWMLKRWQHHYPNAEFIVEADDGVDPFNKSLAVNNAAKKATGDVFVILDADTWVEGPAMAHAIDLAGNGGAHWVIPARKSLRLTREFSETILASDPTGSLTVVNKRAHVEQQGWVVGFCHVVPRRAFEAVGGMDVRYRGWGGEDTSFVRALDVVVGKHRQLTGTVISLWHARPAYPDGRRWVGQGNEHFDARRDLASRYSKARSRDAMLALLHEQYEQQESVSA